MLRNDVGVRSVTLRVTAICGTGLPRGSGILSLMFHSDKAAET